MLGFVLPVASLVLGLFDFLRRVVAWFVLALGLALVYRVLKRDDVL